MIVAFIVAAEIAFWVVLAAGLAVRYLLRRQRASTVLLLAVPLIDVALLAATAWDLRSGGEPSYTHGLAALYLGFTVAYGHSVIAWADRHAAHRLGGGPRPPKLELYGRERTAYEWRIWTRTLLAAAVTVVVIEAMILFVDDPDAATPLRSTEGAAARAVGIHALVALYYMIWPGKAPSGLTPGEAVRRDAG
ncbi:hypothetical protein [Streptomyces millisiae]|uniref:Integral membrane protein n=1 Tax=Streptomyces millisiae TaxID=3075542 RepID=A0ABU2LQF5_9ACTN|nr:hypothetical protein [Streptomyces sp. DSM 44918]MDT0319745.1 hypothetical protein [Streptomyces sp. DSM 44918]